MRPSVTVTSSRRPARPAAAHSRRLAQPDARHWLLPSPRLRRDRALPGRVTSSPGLPATAGI